MDQVWGGLYNLIGAVCGLAVIGFAALVVAVAVAGRWGWDD